MIVTFLNAEGGGSLLTAQRSEYRLNNFRNIGCTNIFDFSGCHH